MKKILVLAFSLIFLAACNHASEESVSPDALTNAKTEAVEAAGEGAVCGGEAKQPCNPGLECLHNNAYHDARGKCVQSVVKAMECPKTKDPVCGLKGIQKNGYLNNCEAERHGAEVLYKGFCEKDTSVVGNCEASAKAIGNCFDVFPGYEFQNGKCTKTHIAGCDAELPFETEAECQAACR